MQELEQALNKRPKIQKNVKKILKEIPQTRGDDTLLIYYYWRKHDKIRISFRRFIDIFFSTSPESITRSRRRVQKLNPDLKPTDRVNTKRLILEEMHKEYYGHVRLTDFGGSE